MKHNKKHNPFFSVILIGLLVFSFLFLIFGLFFFVVGGPEAFTNVFSFFLKFILIYLAIFLIFTLYFAMDYTVNFMKQSTHSFTHKKSAKKKTEINQSQLDQDTIRNSEIATFEARRSLLAFEQGALCEEKARRNSLLTAKQAQIAVEEVQTLNQRATVELQRSSGMTNQIQNYVINQDVLDNYLTQESINAVTSIEHGGYIDFGNMNDNNGMNPW